MFHYKNSLWWIKHLLKISYVNQATLALLLLFACAIFLYKLVKYSIHHQEIRLPITGYTNYGITQNLDGVSDSSTDILIKNSKTFQSTLSLYSIYTNWTRFILSIVQLWFVVSIRKSLDQGQLDSKIEGEYANIDRTYVAHIFFWV